MEQRILLAPGDGSLGPLLRVADDRLGPGEAYGMHAHRAVDVVAVVVAGELRHRWGGGGAEGDAVVRDAVVRTGDAAVLLAGAGLTHDEVAGPDGVRVLQCYLRAAEPAAPARHEVHSAGGWVPLGRDDARLWVARLPEGTTAEAPAGLVLRVRGDGVDVDRTTTAVDVTGPAAVLVWQLDTARPLWARD